MTIYLDECDKERFTARLQELDEFKSNDPLEERECLRQVLLVMREVLEAFEKKALSENKK